MASYGMNFTGTAKKHEKLGRSTRTTRILAYCFKIFFQLILPTILHFPDLSLPKCTICRYIKTNCKDFQRLQKATIWYWSSPTKN